MWDVCAVAYMSGMYYESSFNQPIGNWDASPENMELMFYGATAFNEDLSV